MSEELLQPQDEWVGPVTDVQLQEHHEITIMTTQIEDHGYNIDLSHRTYDRKYFIILEGDKCYGQGPKVHAYLSGAVAIMDWSRTK